MTTLPVGEQTHQAVLPQQPALESVGADTPGSRDETAHGLPVAERGTGRKHGRGETAGGSTGSRRRHADQAEIGSGDAPMESSGYSGGAGSGRVFVLARDGVPLMPCHPARARELLRRSRAVVVRLAPFTIRLKDRGRGESEVAGVQLRIDPGSKATGIAVTDTKAERLVGGSTATVRRGLVSVELLHRGEQIRRAMAQRAGYRRRRRSANCRYRAPRNRNRARSAGWLAPSLRHRVESVASVTDRLRRLAPVTEIHVEHAAFDTHAMSEGRGLEAIEYRRGALAGTEIRELLLVRWQRSCAYCGASGVPLNAEHIRPRSRGGSSRLSNLTLACVPCNKAKGATPVEEFLAGSPERLERILRDVGVPLHDAAAMNATRGRLISALEHLGPPVHTWTGARTKWNREAMGLGKTHTLDALSVGGLDHENGDAIVRVCARILVVKAAGRGVYARTTPDRFGFPRLRRPRRKRHYGFVTGDLVRATVPKGRWKGTWSGRLAARSTGRHSLTTAQGRFNVSYRNVQLLQRADGYAYSLGQELRKKG
ncbi:RNA-guided endonuclease IscB [Streptomyces pristinaespiralis]|nr:RNA-guided endonuclease IscB [Streptomyces pristinaespiralis]QMU14886.1 HNH endonuclease [Streptomyces pristinaespiralis]